MSKLEISAEDARALLWDDGPEGISIVKDDIIDNSRWSILHNIVIKKDDKFYEDNYSVGATENQDESAWEYTEPNFVEVEPYEKTVTDYRKINS